MHTNIITIKQLDQEIKQMDLLTQAPHPNTGWIRTFRKALGMTIKQCAERLGVSSSRITKIESAELEGAITVKTLKSVAKIFNCTFVYAFIPKTSLESLVKQRARAIATEHIKRTMHTMDLEAQHIEKEWLEVQISDLSYEILKKSWKHLWEE